MLGWTGARVVVASHNPGKVAELSALLRERGIEPISAGALGLPSPPETEDTLEANARLKAKFVTERSGLPALADDSGIAFPALGGWPGVETAREVDVLGGWQSALASVAQRLGGRPRVLYTSVLALAWPDGRVIPGTGSLAGDLVWPQRGDGGAPFDRAFQPDGFSMTLGELDAGERARRNPRALALGVLEHALGAAPISRGSTP